MSKIIVGRYIPGDSLIYKMDPRSKLLVTILFILAIFLANNSITYAIVTIFVFGCDRYRIKCKSILGWR